MAEEKTKRAASAGEAGGRGRVLIVDDDPEFLIMADASLRAQGFHVVRAAGGLRAVFFATQEAPDAVLCDLGMPGIDGFIVAEALRADPATSHAVIVACTGLPELETRAQVRSSAFDAVVAKPVDWDHVVRILVEGIATQRGTAGA